MNDDVEIINNPKAFKNTKTGRLLPYSATLHKFYKQGKLNLVALESVPDELKPKADEAKKPAANRRAAAEKAKAE